MLEMKATGAHVGFLPSLSARSSPWPIAAALLFFAVLWFEAINQLQAEWSFNPQYGYGWSVPFLALYLLWRRWSWHPLARPPDSRVLPTALIVFCAFLFFPIRFVAEANPDWRLLSWALALVGVSMSVLWIFMSGGWPWPLCISHLVFSRCRAMADALRAGRRARSHEGRRFDQRFVAQYRGNSGPSTRQCNRGWIGLDRD
jgi:hypothetical protein